VFPANAFTSFIYFLLPPFTGIAILGGIGGISIVVMRGGILKGPLLEIALNYNQQTST
jgi:hypothetical protein